MSNNALIAFLILGLFVSSVDCCPFARHKKRDVSDIRSKLTIHSAEGTPFTVVSALTSSYSQLHNWETGIINAVKLDEKRLSTVDLSIRLANITLMATKIRFILKDNDAEKTWSNYINIFDEVCPLTHVQEQYVHLCFKKIAILKNIVLPNVVTFPDAARHRDNILQVELSDEEDTILFSFFIHTFEE